MTINDMLLRLSGVRSVGCGKWLACCPVHDDRHPSLSIREGEKGLLLYCLAGCSLVEICKTIGIHQHQLFYDSDASHPRQTRKTNPKFNWRALANQFQVNADCHWLDAKSIDPHDFKSVDQHIRQMDLSDTLRDIAFCIREDGLKREKELLYAVA